MIRSEKGLTKIIGCPVELAEDLIALYEIDNFGFGPAVNIYLCTNDKDYALRRNLKVGESQLFHVDIQSLKDESQKITILVKFCDIYNNEYQQKLSGEIIIEEGKFNFSITQEQFAPELIRNLQ